MADAEEPVDAAAEGTLWRRRRGGDGANAADGHGPLRSGAGLGNGQRPRNDRPRARQIRALMSQSAGEDVNWTLAHDVARGVAAQGGDPDRHCRPSARIPRGRHGGRVVARRRDRLRPARAPSRPCGAAPNGWRPPCPRGEYLAGPVASSVSHALGGVLRSEDSGALDGAATPQGLIGSVSPTVCGMHVGQAAGAMAREAFGATDLGIPLAGGATRGRGAARRSRVSPRASTSTWPTCGCSWRCARPPTCGCSQSASWLPGQLHAAIERYARGVTVDLEALDNAVTDAGMGDPAALQEALTTGIFSPTHTDEQKRDARVDRDVARADRGLGGRGHRAGGRPAPARAGPAARDDAHGRRAAGGPAEDTFSALLGLTLRPRRLRDAADMWATLTAPPGIRRARRLLVAPRPASRRRDTRRLASLGGQRHRARPTPTTSTARSRPCCAARGKGPILATTRQFGHAERRLTGIVGYRVYA